METLIAYFDINKDKSIYPKKLNILSVVQLTIIRNDLNLMSGDFHVGQIVHFF